MVDITIVFVDKIELSSPVLSISSPPPGPLPLLPPTPPPPPPPTSAFFSAHNAIYWKKIVITISLGKGEGMLWSS